MFYFNKMARNLRDDRRRHNLLSKKIQWFALKRNQVTGYHIYCKYYMCINMYSYHGYHYLSLVIIFIATLFLIQQPTQYLCTLYYYITQFIERLLLDLSYLSRFSIYIHQCRYVHTALSLFITTYAAMHLLPIYYKVVFIFCACAHYQCVAHDVLS